MLREFNSLKQRGGGGTWTSLACHVLVKQHMDQSVLDIQNLTQYNLFISQLLPEKFPLLAGEARTKRNPCLSGTCSSHYI